MQARAQQQTADAAYTATLSAKDEELQAAIKQRQLAQEMRRSDALLAKRIMCAQMKQAGVGPGAVADADASTTMPGGTMAMQLALAAHDEVTLRQVR